MSPNVSLNTRRAKPSANGISLLTDFGSMPRFLSVPHSHGHLWVACWSLAGHALKSKLIVVLRCFECPDVVSKLLCASLTFRLLISISDLGNDLEPKDTERLNA